MSVIIISEATHYIILNVLMCTLFFELGLVVGMLYHKKWL